jgi:hypothetical protein
MEYNTSLPKLIISEYGRHIQKMVDHAVTIKDREERNTVAKAIIQVMGQLNPHLRDITDFKHKLWDHLFIISDFKLDVDSPFPKPARETFQTKPERVEYPENEIKYRYYGKTIEKIIEKATKYPEGEEKTVLIEMIANHLKKSYLNWNLDSVSDEVIIKHLSDFSKGKLKLGENSKLSNTIDILARNKKKVPYKNDRDRERKYGSGNGKRRNFKSNS